MAEFFKHVLEFLLTGVCIIVGLVVVVWVFRFIEAFFNGEL